MTLLQVVVGDGIWWLAILSPFTPYFFAPLILLLPAALLLRRRALWGALALPALIFALHYGELFLPQPLPTPGASAERLSVMSFNVWGWSRSAETARIPLDEGSPDVVLLQEITPPMRALVEQELGATYPYRLFGPDPRHPELGILSRYPLRAVASDVLDGRDWRFQIAEVEAPGGTFTLYNVHPHSSHLLVYLEEGSDVAERVRASFRERRAFFEVLLVDVRQREGPVVVGGDFNTTDRSEVYRMVTAVEGDHDPPLRDAHRAVGWGMGHTFPAYRGSYRGIPILPRQMHIDMILYSDAWMALSSRVGASGGESDHLPVIVVLVWQQTS